MENMDTFPYVWVIGIACILLVVSGILITNCCVPHEECKEITGTVFEYTRGPRTTLYDKDGVRYSISGRQGKVGETLTLSTCQ